MWASGSDRHVGVTQRSHSEAVGLCALAAVMLLAGCAGDLTAREKGTLGGAALGAGAGALIGGAAGQTGTGALIGAGVGALTGVLVGEALQNREQSKPSQPSPPVGQTPVQPAPSLGQAPASMQEASLPPKLAADPTRGRLANGTPWRLDIFLDVDPSQVDSATPIILKPQENTPANLDIGPHRIIARAYVETQFGTRLAGRFDRTVKVDPRSSGWSLRFHEGDFR